VNHAQSIHSINFGLFILFHQLTRGKLSYFAQTCQLVRMASTWTEILAKIILHSHLASWRAVDSHTDVDRYDLLRFLDEIFFCKSHVK
jgi:hypothetical protein